MCLGVYVFLHFGQANVYSGRGMRIFKLLQNIYFHAFLCFPVVVYENNKKKLVVSQT